MKPGIFKNLIEKLQNDAILLSYLGGPYVFRAKKIAPAKLPSVTVRETSESRQMRPCYTSIKASIPYTILVMCNPSIEISVWVNSEHTGFPQTGEDVDIIASRISDLLLDSTEFVVGTHGWRQIGQSQMHEDDKSIWHNVVRFSFEYHIDTTGETVHVIEGGTPSTSGTDAYEGGTP